MSRRETQPGARIERFDAAVDGGRGLVGKLLVDDRFGERAEQAARGLQLHGERPDGADHLGQRGVGRAQMSDGAFGIEAKTRHRCSNNGPAERAAAPSISRMRRLVATPPLAEKPPILPSAPSTRWQGTMMAMGLRPSAWPTSRDSCGAPRRLAISP